MITFCNFIMIIFTRYYSHNIIFKVNLYQHFVAMISRCYIIIHILVIINRELRVQTLYRHDYSTYTSKAIGYTHLDMI